MQIARKAALLGRPAPIALAAPALVFPRPVQAFRPRADVADPVKMLAELQKAFEEMKATNDERLKALEKGRDDVVQAEKVERINSAVGDLQATIDGLVERMAALTLNGTGRPGSAASAATPERRAYAAAFDRAFRRGEGAANLDELAIKASLQSSSDPDGGWTVPPEMEATIDRVLATTSAMRGLSRVVQITADEYSKLVSQGGATTGWVGEADARTETTPPQLAKITVEAMELYAEPFATQKLLDDSAIDIGAWLGDEVSITMGEQEGAAFVTGTGVKKPRGILGYNTVADASYAWGKIGYIGTGGVGFAADPAGFDALTDALYALKQGYRNNATWLANRKTFGTLRKMKDSQGHYQWQPSVAAGQPSTLMGYPVADDDNMNDVGSNLYPVAIADFKRAYLIVDRIGMRVLRDPYTNKPFVGFYITKRVGGGVVNFEAIKLVKCA